MRERNPAKAVHEIYNPWAFSHCLKSLKTCPLCNILIAELRTNFKASIGSKNYTFCFESECIDF